MKLLSVIKERLANDSLLKMKQSLISKRSMIQLEIKKRESAIAEIKDNLEIIKPGLIMKADSDLSDVLTNPDSTFEDFLDKYTTHRSIVNDDGVAEAAEIASLSADVDLLNEMLLSFPTVTEIKALTAKKKTTSKK